MDVTWLAGWLAWLAVTLVFVALDLFRSPDESYLRRMAGVEAPKGTWRQLADRVGPAVAVWFPAANLERLDQRLVWAGSLLGMKSETFVGLKVVAAAGALAVGGALSAFGLPPVIVPMLVVLAYMFPDMWLSSTVEKRQKAVARSLPVMVSLLVTALRAGVELAPAMQHIGEQMAGPLGEEMRLAWREMATGRSRAAALRAMADRTGVGEVERFVQTIVTAEERGGMNLSEVLSSFMDDVRDSRRRRLEEEANKLPNKMLAPLVVCIFLPMLLMLMAPAVFSFMEIF